MKTAFFIVRLWFFFSAGLLFIAILTTDNPIKITTTWVFEIALIFCTLVLFAIVKEPKEAKK